MPASILFVLAVALSAQAPAATSTQTAEIEEDAPAASNDARPAPDARAKEDTGMFSTVGLFTLGGGALGAVVAGGLVVLSPCLCGLTLACPVAAVATGAGAGIGALVASDGELGRALMPILVGSGVGAGAGLLAGVLALGTAVLIDFALPNPGLSAGGAAFNVGTASISAGVVALLLVGAGSFGAAAATSWAFERGAPDAPVVDDADPPAAPKQEQKKKPPEPPAGDQVAMAF